MLSIKAITSILVSLAAATASAAAVNTTPLYAEVIPGPGLPSLKTLGLTSKDLYTMTTPEIDLTKMHATFDSLCGPSDQAYTNVDGVIACYNYLRNLSAGTRCGVSAYRTTTMCTSGTAHITGQSINSSDESSLCTNFATAVLWSIDHCTRADQSVAGHCAAYGNGNFIISSTNVKW